FRCDGGRRGADHAYAAYRFLRHREVDRTRFRAEFHRHRNRRVAGQGAAPRGVERGPDHDFLADVFLEFGVGDLATFVRDLRGRGLGEARNSCARDERHEQAGPACVNSSLHRVYAAAAARASIWRMNRSNRPATSCGPGLASGCPWKPNAGVSRNSKPCRLASNSEPWVMQTFAGRLAGSTAKPWFWLEIMTCPLAWSRTG